MSSWRACSSCFGVVFGWRGPSAPSDMSCSRLQLSMRWWILKKLINPFNWHLLKIHISITVDGWAQEVDHCSRCQILCFLTRRHREIFFSSISVTNMATTQWLTIFNKAWKSISKLKVPVSFLNSFRKLTLQDYQTRRQCKKGWSKKLQLKKITACASTATEFRVSCQCIFFWT